MGTVPGKQTQIVIGVIILIIIIAVAAYYAIQKPAQTATQTSSPTTTSTAELKLLRVGTSPDFPPFEYVAKNGSIVGFDIDLIRLLAKKIGYDDIEIVTMDFDSLIPALKQGKFDVIAAGMTITPEREKEVSFTKPYWNANQAILVRKDSDFKPKSLDDLAGKTVGVQTGTTGEYYVEDYINKTGINIEVKTYSSFVLAVQDLVNGRIDAVVVDTPVAKMFEKQYPVVVSGIIETGEQYGFAVRKEDTQLLNELNKALEEVMNSPEWEKLVEKYFGSSG